MKLSAALTTLVTLTTFASALPNKALHFNKRQSFNQTNNGTNPNGNGVDPNANTLPASTQTVVQTLTTTITQQYTTLTQTSTFTATVVIPGGNGVAAIPSALPGSTGSGSTGSGSTGSGSTGSGSTGSGSTGSGSTGSGSTGSGSTGSGSTGSGLTGSGSSGSGSGSGSDSQCVCSAPAVVATGIYSVAVQTLVDLGSTTYTIVNPSTTLGLMTISAGQVVGATPTITQIAKPAANTNAALAPNQVYQTVSVPGANGAPSINIVVIITLVTPVVTTVTGTNPNGNGVDSGANGLPMTSAGPFANVSSTSTSASFSASLSTMSASQAVGAAQAQTSGAPTASAPTTTPQATVAPNTQATQVGSLGTTPLVNQENFANDMVAAHNLYRARHGVTPVTYNSDLAAVALANANANAAAMSFKHTNEMNPGSDPYGENIASQYGNNNPDTLVYLWYDEIRAYNYTAPGYNSTTGHFTQLVWDDSVEIGCAYIQETFNNNQYFLACEYNTPGNIVGSTDAETAASFNQHVKAVLPGAAPYAAPPANI